MTVSFKTFLTSYQNEKRRIDNQTQGIEVPRESLLGNQNQGAETIRGTGLFREPFFSEAQEQGTGEPESIVRNLLRDHLFGEASDGVSWTASCRILDVLSDQNKMDADELVRASDLPVLTFLDAFDTLRTNQLVSVQDNYVALTREGERLTKLGQWFTETEK